MSLSPLSDSEELDFPASRKRFRSGYRRSAAGFTLLELVAGLMILGVVVAIVIPRYIDLDRNARIRAIEAGIAELNGREKLTWARVKLSTNGWQSDLDLFNQNNYDLGREYDWVTGPDDGSGNAEGGGTLRFQESFSSMLGRVDSTSTAPAHWYRK